MRGSCARAPGRLGGMKFAGSTLTETESMRRLLLVFSLLALPAALQAQRGVLVNWRDFGPHELRSAAFSLPSAQEIEIHAVGANEERRGLLSGDWFDNDGPEERGWRGNAWILDARTRNVVWELERAKTDGGRGGMERFDGKLRLPAGNYEAYFASYSGSTGLSFSDLGDLVRGRDMSDREWKDNGESEDFRLTIRGAGRPLNATQRNAARSDLTDRTVLSLVRPGPESTRRVGFSLDKPTAIEIYAIGEVREDATFDYGWLANADTHERLWRLTYDATKHAGGADKTRVARWRQTLPAGRYVVAYITDDSHDATDWNSAPPHDPDYAGLTVFVANAADKGNAKSFPYEPAGVSEAIAAIVRVGDDEMREAGFTLTKPLGVRIHALGEGTRSRMVDYGWIVNARTGRRVWSMDYSRTEHAGGAEKNRLAEETIRLEPGDYIVHYRSDGSHSYDDWNSGAPMDGEYWGIVLYPSTGKLDPEVVKAYDESNDPSVIARLTRMGDDERRRVRFRLDEAAEVRVYALGEGDDGEMHDYAWIEDGRTGRAVWEMTYRTTGHAGGGDKNRVYDGTLRLPAGEYVLHYESDDSHSYEDWNTTPPDDAAHWGVTVYRAR